MKIIWGVLALFDVVAWVLTFTVDRDIGNAAMGIGIVLVFTALCAGGFWIQDRKNAK